MKPKPEDFKTLPAVDKLLNLPEVVSLISIYGKELVIFSIRSSLDFFRTSINKGNPPPSQNEIFDKIEFFIRLCGHRSLRKVINATGVIIHTNLGRAPFGDALINDSINVLKRYNNLEFNLNTGARGNRNDHASELLKFLTGAEDVLVVNNNAAAVMLILRAFAKKKEVIVSRGELIEIGGSFRIPEIMKASECKMVEVGTTNKTNINDYRNAISNKTAMLFKAHKSNYVIKGFTQEAELEEMVELGKQHNIPVLYDIGSGLLKKYNHKLFIDEPNVRQSLEKGIDLICFSGDKLLGGPQAGIIAGKKIFIDKLKKEPMLRALRVCKTTLALLETACMYYLDEKTLNEKNLLFKIFNRKKDDLKNTAELLKNELEKNNMPAEVVASIGQCGGGTLPDGEIESFSVMIKNENPNKERSEYAEKMYQGLLSHKQPVLGVLKKGNIYFDILTLFNDEIDELAKIIIEVNQTVKK
ncbi:MAG TPA: L-seryl-tRNA(Sec) selenium transferase [Bacteroidales bacterium]|nr:L-seryl-tRNA(Sec) selenium transferase [Bacteroidales bacterium]HPS16491.1 L-seryl-tRNA(Sec) selenium transferase [Bacteroidales bacterium]